MEWKPRQELKPSGSLEAAAFAEATEECYLLACSACFLIELRTTNPELAPNTKRALPYQSLVKKIPFSHAYSPIFLFVCFVIVVRR